MRQALITLLLYVVPLPVVLAGLRCVEKATVFYNSPGLRYYTYSRYHITDFWSTIQTMFWWHNGSLRGTLIALLIGFSFWALHQCLRGAAFFILQKTRPASVYA